MKTVGKQLQDARLEKGWSPELAARETKIRVDRLHELESDDYSHFSSPTYARGFVRTYARALGLDEYKILRQLDNKLPEDDNASFANDTGVPYMPEPSKVTKPFELGRGVYIAAGLGAAVLLLIAFILVQVYRAGYFAQALPATSGAMTNALPAVSDTETTQRALPADSNAPPVALPIDNSSAVATAPASSPAAATLSDTNAAPRALPVDPAALAATTTQAQATAPSSPVAPTTAVPSPTTTPLDTTSPPRALPVDPNATATTSIATVPTQPVVQPRPAASLSARQSNARPHAPEVVSSDSPAAGQASPPAAATSSSGPVVADNTPQPGAASAPAPETPSPSDSATQPAAQAPSAPVAIDAPPESSPTPRALPVVLPSSATESPASSGAPDAASALTGSDSTAPGDASAAPSPDTRGKRLVLTASRDSFVRVVALDGVHGDHVRYSSMLHSGQSISFSDRKYSINVGDPAAVDISLDGINYGPHSDHSEPDTFTVESREP